MRVAVDVEYFRGIELLGVAVRGRITDQDDLPPYEILDPILKGYIEDYKGTDELAKMGFDKKRVADVIDRVVRSEYKRHQAPPGLKVTARAFGYGRRYPTAEKYQEES